MATAWLPSGARIGRTASPWGVRIVIPSMPLGLAGSKARCREPVRRLGLDQVLWGAVLGRAVARGMARTAAGRCGCRACGMGAVRGTSSGSTTAAGAAIGAAAGDGVGATIVAGASASSRSATGAASRWGVHWSWGSAAMPTDATPPARAATAVVIRRRGLRKMFMGDLRIPSSTGQRGRGRISSIVIVIGIVPGGTSDKIDATGRGFRDCPACQRHERASPRESPGPEQEGVRWRGGRRRGRPGGLRRLRGPPPAG